VTKRSITAETHCGAVSSFSLYTEVIRSEDNLFVQSAMVDLSDGSWLFPLRLIQLTNSMIVLGLAILGRITVPTFASSINAPDILLAAAIVHTSTTILLLLIYYVFKLGGKVAVVAATVLFELINYGMSIASFVNMIYDFKFSAGGNLSVCMLDDIIDNPAPSVGCNSYRAAAAFCALSWFLWTFSMTYIISQIHKRVRKSQMQGYIQIPKGKEAGRGDIESRMSTRSPFNHIHGSPSDATTATSPSSPLSAEFGSRTSR